MMKIGNGTPGDDETMDPLMNICELASIERDLASRNLILHREAYSFSFGTTSPNKVAVVGHCGHVFIGEGSNQWQSQLDGNVEPSPSVLSSWVALFDARSRKASEAGVRLVNLIVPEKQLVLHAFAGHEEVPEQWLSRPAAQIVKAAGRDAALIYPLEPLRSAQAWAELYWRGNSHWCATGCVIGGFAALKKLGLYLEFDRICFKKYASAHDLMHHLSGTVPVEETIRIFPAGVYTHHNRMYENTGTHTGSHYVIRNDDAPSRETIVIFGDSYSYDAGLAYMTSAFFLETHFLWSRDIDWEYVAARRAKYVLWESTERFLLNVPVS